MAERVVYPQWRNQMLANNYPFADGCVVPSGLASVFVDASLYLPAEGPAWLSRISVSEERVLVSVHQGGETATGQVDRGSSVDIIKLFSPAGAARGVLVGAAGFPALFAMPVGDTDYDQDDTEFVARVVAPLPRDGVCSVRVGDITMSGPVTLFAEEGVRLTPMGNKIRVDVIGQHLSATDTATAHGIKTINLLNPDATGLFRFVSSLVLASDSALRISADTSTVTFSLAGVNNA